MRHGSNFKFSGSEPHCEFEFEVGLLRSIRDIGLSSLNEITRLGSKLVIAGSPHKFALIFGIYIKFWDHMGCSKVRAWISIDINIKTCSNPFLTRAIPVSLSQSDDKNGFYINNY